MKYKDYIILEDIAKCSISGSLSSMALYDFVGLCEIYTKIKVCMYISDLLTYYRRKEMIENE